AKTLQVVEFLFDAFQITAVELRAVSAVERAGLARVADLLVPDRVRHDRLIAVKDRTRYGAARHAVVVRLVAVAKTVGKNLIDVCVLQPRWRLKIRVVNRELK